MSRALSAAVPAEQVVPVVRSCRGPHPAVLAATALSFATWLVLAWPYFTFANDDIYVFTVARQGGLTRHLLGLNLFSHFAPFNRFLHWVALTISPLDVRVGFAIGALMVLGMLAAYLWLLGELQITWRRQALAVLVCTVSITMLGIGTWWGEVIHIPTSLGAIFLVLAAHVRATRLHSWRWHVASVLLLIAGFTTQERTLYAPAIALALDLFVVWRGLPLVTALRRLWSVKWPLLAMFVISAAGGAWVIRTYFQPEPRPHLHDVLALFPVSLFKYFVPALLGFYPASVGMPWPVAAILVLLVVAVLLRTRLGNVKPLIFLAVVYLLYYGLLAVGRLGVYSVDVEASDLQYAAYVVPFCLIALGTAEWPRLRVSIAPSRALQLSAVGALAICLVVTGVVWEHTVGGMQVRQHAHAFLTSLRASRAEWTSPSVTVIPLRVPTDVAASWIDPYGREETFLGLIDPGITPGLLRPDSHFAVIDEHAAVHDAVLDPMFSLDGSAVASELQVTPQMAPQGGGCYSAEADGAGLVLQLPRTVTANPLMVELSYDAPRNTGARFGVASAGQVRIDPLLQMLPSGRHVVVVNLEDLPAAAVSIGLDPGTSLCVDSLALVRPMLRDAPGSCRFINRYGVIGEPAMCPNPTSK